MGAPSGASGRTPAAGAHRRPPAPRAHQGQRAPSPAPCKHPTRAWSSHLADERSRSGGKGAVYGRMSDKSEAKVHFRLRTGSHSAPPARVGLQAMGRLRPPPSEAWRAAPIPPLLAGTPQARLLGSLASHELVSELRVLSVPENPPPGSVPWRKLALIGVSFPFKQTLPLARCPDLSHTLDGLHQVYPY